MAQNNAMDNVEVRKRYYKSGALWWETPYVNGMQHGIAKIYYESGALRREIPYVNGEAHGIVRGYDKDNSNVCCLTLYDNDHKVASVKI